MDPKILKKYFNNTCTPFETEQVLAWFKTEEGQAYLQQRLDRDLHMVREEQIKPLIHNVPSDSMFNAIEANMKPVRNRRYQPHQKKATYWQVAAVILVLLASSVFYLQSQVPSKENPENIEQIYYAVGPSQQKELILRDGTKIRLNSNTQLWISETYGEPVREITLQGEAYFEVTHNEEKPFIIHTADATIKDLGTAFNIRARPEGGDVQVAVIEGKVKMWAGSQPKNKAVKLTKGQFGYLDLSTHAITVNNFEVHNHLSWMNMRLKFHQARLEQVSRQLHHLYGVSFAYAAHSLKALVLTADFQRESLKKALEVISMTLRIDYRINGEKVMWLPKDHSSDKTVISKYREHIL